MDGFAPILSPPFADALFPWILLPAPLGESSLRLWLTLEGIDTAKWKIRVEPGQL